MIPNNAIDIYNLHIDDYSRFQELSNDNSLDEITRDMFMLVNYYLRKKHVDVFYLMSIAYKHNYTYQIIGFIDQYIDNLGDITEMVDCSMKFPVEDISDIKDFIDRVGAILSKNTFGILSEYAVKYANAYYALYGDL